jgi:DNA-directed RNA polymerase subunit K/omega
MTDRKSSMTKYEYTRLKGFRLEQLSQNAFPYVVVDRSASPHEIFDMEFAAGKLPYTISRKLPNGTTENHKVKDLCYTVV